MIDRFKLISVERDGDIAVVLLNRPDKRNAVSDALIWEIEDFFDSPPEGVKAVVLGGVGKHFCAGLDLSEHKSRSAHEVVKHSRMWHRIFDKVEFGGLPVVAALQGAVIGGGLEMATSTHVRVADTTTFFGLPEGRRGIFTGGGASVRVAGIIGAGRMREMMLTGRQYQAEDGYRLGLAHYLVEPGQALQKAKELAREIAGNAEMSNYLIIQALARIDNMSSADGLFTESLAAALTLASGEAAERMQAFLNRSKT